jgi:hypothetical protein
MKALIEAVLGKVADSKSNVVVTNYFPILSKDSIDGDGIDALLSLRGIGIEALLRVSLPGTLSRSFLVNQVVDQCLLFWQRSSAALSRAVASVGSTRVQFVDAGFETKNALFATDPWLWSPLDGDPAQEERKGACVLCEKNPFKLPMCLKASAGHPNIPGAAAYAKAVLASLGA